jgi:hypothetical protein
MAERRFPHIDRPLDPGGRIVLPQIKDAPMVQPVCATITAVVNALAKVGLI